MKTIINIKLFSFVIIASSFVSCPAIAKSVGGGKQADLHIDLDKFTELAEALKYGDDCEWEAEDYRQKSIKQALSGDVDASVRMMKNIVKRDYKMCSAAQLFVCDKESEKCVCGDAGYEVQHGVNRKLYTLEGDNKCRWETNSYCAGEDYLESQSTPGLTVDSKCKIGTTCKTVEGEMCSFQNIIGYLFKNYELKYLSNATNVLDLLASGKVCTCEADRLQGVGVVDVDLRPKSHSQRDVNDVADDSHLFTDDTYEKAESTRDNSGKPNSLRGKDDDGRRKRSVLVAGEDFSFHKLAIHVAGPAMAANFQ